MVGRIDQQARDPKRGPPVGWLLDEARPELDPILS